ncbi:ApbE family protein [Microbacterium hydrocarbonoxydans]|uniref:FAD:protein FMN transferase n=1 Tax=Microbacterium hydrocarbonoxydans TaxID=273678 RepID=A0A0M2HXR7_9MICO|nr:FAD:protein FMN transferase [Microbacterium hydrocarbonoxydans]KJL49214.1 ApbE family protein [Microbacterium hydrocarbonoxydans]
MAIWRFDAIGTRWEIEGDLDGSDRSAVSEVIERFDREWSRFRDDSAVTRLGSAGGVLESADAAPMLDAYAALSSATAGAVNPLVGASLEALGYDAAYTLAAGAALAAPAAWSEVVAWNHQGLTASAPALIDVGALGKGRLVDLVFSALARVPGDLVVDAGGDMRVRGSSVRTALEHPFDATKAIGVVELQDAALCGSAINRRAWGDGLHHVLDARTGRPVRTWAATWALGAQAMRADAIATALFFDGGPALAADWGVEWVRMTTDGKVERSAGWTGQLFTTRP